MLKKIILLSTLFVLHTQAGCDLSTSYDVITDYYMDNSETSEITPGRFRDGIDASFFLNTFEDKDENIGESLTFFEKFESNFEGSTCMMLYIRYVCTGKGKISHQFKHCENE